MSELSTLARPYAEAVFRLAQGEKDLAGWSSRLQSLALIVSDAQVARLIADPAVSTGRVAGLIIEVAGSDLGERGGNFAKVLAENDRLSLLPEIGAQFETLKANAEGTLEATITSAQELTQAQLDDLVAGLKTKFNRAVNVQVAVDPELIGGAVIAIGDQVIDGSVKGRLQRMSFALQA
ncbi:F0F1 ATP synthase subunit delta [Thiobacillus denitrificans]|uniref:ATP synthase subunit delta n=1 Tax=Thiobacillus denitrificans TaxID=36861 RepID=A0A106BN50_THIDE|nr:F0F1 ATP synthase subunit delta [Thiobacillus denitrificans]KVW95495.1 ATP synthase F0F1 subunit delta [Thiobacillus denitrificans]